MLHCTVGTGNFVLRSSNGQTAMTESPSFLDFSAITNNDFAFSVPYEQLAPFPLAAKS